MASMSVTPEPPGPPAPGRQQPPPLTRPAHAAEPGHDPDHDPEHDPDHGTDQRPGADARSPQAVATVRLDLLPLAVGHATEMAAVLADPGLHTFVGGAPATPEALRARYERLVAGSPDPEVRWWNWVVRLRAEDCLVGTVQATVRRSPHGPVAEIAWVVGTRWQGRGIATEAAEALVARLGRQEIRTVIAHIHPGHLASAAVASAAGLAPTGQWQDGERTWQRRTTR
jgi:RimJ/RimL family protein N-acetyltransferase